MNYHQLPLEVQLNVDADTLAENRRIIGEYSPRYTPLFSQARAQLIIDEDSITTNVRSGITAQYQEREMIAYYIHQYGWTYNIFSNIHWKSMFMLMKHFHRPLLVKLSQGLLPTNAIRYRYDPNISPRCPACHLAQETNEHLFQCPCYADWHQKLFIKIQQFFIKVSVPDKFAYEILLHLKHFFHQTTQGTLLQYDYIFQFQTSIEWRNFFRGQVSRELQSQYLGITNSPKQHFIYHLMKIIWSEFPTLWELRNLYENGQNVLQKE